MSDTTTRKGSIFKVAFTTNVPATAEAWDSTAKERGSCLEAALTNDFARGYYSRLRDAVLDKVVSVTAEPVKKVGEKPGKKEGEVESVYESQDVYIQRVIALGHDQAVRDAVAEAVSALSFNDWLAEEPEQRVAKGGKPTKESMQVAEATQGKWAAGTSNPAKTLAKFRELVPTTPDFDDNISTEDLARHVMAYLKAQKQALSL